MVKREKVKRVRSFKLGVSSKLVELVKPGDVEKDMKLSEGRGWPILVKDQNHAMPLVGRLKSSYSVGVISYAVFLSESGNWKDLFFENLEWAYKIVP